MCNAPYPILFLNFNLSPILLLPSFFLLPSANSLIRVA